MSIRLALIVVAASPLIACAIDYAWTRLQLWAGSYIEDAYDRAGVRYVDQGAIDRWRVEQDREKFDAIVEGLR